MMAREATMRKKLLLWIMLIGVFPVAFAQMPSPKVSAFEQEVLNAEAQLTQALQEKNVAYVEQAVASDFAGVALNGDSFDRSEIVEAAREGISKDRRTYEVEVVKMADDCAVVSYSEIMPGDHPRYRHVSDSWVKQGGTWKLKFQQRTPRLWSALDLD